MNMIRFFSLYVLLAPINSQKLYRGNSFTNSKFQFKERNLSSLLYEVNINVYMYVYNVG